MDIEKICEKYNLGKVKKISRLNGGLMHKVFKVETDKSTYCIKVLNSEVMSRKDAFNNFVVSESISNLAKQNRIPASSALKIDGNYLIKLDNIFYMIFDFVEGKILNDEEITIEHCRKIGNLLAHIHSLDYKQIGLEPNVLKNETICHLDMDPKNVIWNNDNPIIIDWEAAKLSNPEKELLEVALCWSGFLSNKFNDEKFITIFREYLKCRNINNVNWYDIICGNLRGRFDWLKYNFERSFLSDKEEIKLSKNEIIKTIDEINRYIDLIEKLNSLINMVIKK